MTVSVKNGVGDVAATEYAIGPSIIVVSVVVGVIVMVSDCGQLLWSL